ncbi:TRNA dihydrouridine synthase [Spironucleus salmonicida]|uniref:tRNA dihydrouridine synthase n=1 Tax=Spironucleus salmonicida TaxID=348837 RepID=V6LJF5_9EUKA|nr:TRNA dihydrouridine synthase [Spironucleus salmonicida]|eukprot:EST44513.1 tRNA dihydrouridine synthase [Spironucleus salmonicida]
MKCLAPMVEGSEYPFRQLVSHFGVTHFWSPMYNVTMLKSNEKQIQQIIRTIKQENRNIIVQLAGNNPNDFEEIIAKLKVVKNIEYFDLNLGCAQVCAQRGNFGSYLMEERDIIQKILQVYSNNQVQISVKTRIFSSIDKTKDFIEFLIKNNVTMITLHGRLSKLKLGCFSGDALMQDTVTLLKDMQKKYVYVKFIYNGGIYSYNQVEHLNQMGIGAMSAQIILQNPMLMTPQESFPILDQYWYDKFEQFNLDQNILQDIKYNEIQSFDITNLYLSVSNDKQNLVIKKQVVPMLFDTKQQRINRIKACYLFCHYCEYASQNNLEVTISCVLSISMSLFGRDFLKYQTDLRDQIVQKDYSHITDHERIMKRCQIIKTICQEAVKRLMDNKGFQKHNYQKIDEK